MRSGNGRGGMQSFMDCGAAAYFFDMALQCRHAAVWKFDV
jgi:hypothetical protein